MATRSRPRSINPQHAVTRAALIERLDAATGTRRTLIVAPPGSGKSVLLQQWMAERADGVSAYVALDPRDLDKHELARHLVTALARIDRRVGELARRRVAHDGCPIGRLLTGELVHEVARVGPAVLVLDGIEVIGDEALLRDLCAFVDAAPPNLHVVIASRYEPPVGTIDGSLVEDDTRLGPDDLAFDVPEAAQLLDRISGRSLSARQVETLVTKTEGWVAGLQLAALALRDEEDIDAFVDRFSGEDVDIAEYLTEEVLSHETEAVRRFLLDTSVLHRLEPLLCDALTARDDSQKMLLVAERRSLLLRSRPRGDEPGSREGQSYRYHGLFRDLLQHELRTSSPERMHDLRLRAAAWHLRRWEPEDAVEYLLDAHDWTSVLDIVAAHGRTMFASGRASIALRWLDRLPSSVRLDNTIVALEHAALLTMTGGTVFAEETIEQLCRTRELSRGEQVVVDAIRCTWVQSHSPPEHVLTASDAVLGALDTVLPCDLPDVLGISSHDSLRDIAIACRARALWHRGETSEARAALEHLVDAGIEFPPWRISAIGALALLEAWSGRLESAHEYAQDAIRLARLHDLVLHPSTIDSLLAMGHVLRERGAFDRAALVLDEAHTIAASIRRSASLAVHTVEAALLELGLGRPRAGLDRLASFAAAGHREPWPAITSRLCAVEARLYLAAGESHITERVLRDRPPSAAISRARVELAVAAGDLSSARSVLEGWPERHDICSELDRRLWRAVVEDLDGRRAAAVQAIRLALALGEPDGHVQAFLDAGPDVRRILRYVVRSWPTHYVAMLLDLADLTTRLRSNPVHGEVTLSDRELVVLQYLPSRMSNAEIARHLYVSRNTVKSHLRSIYRSLGVTSRRDAVDRGAELGLL